MALFDIKKTEYKSGDQKRFVSYVFEFSSTMYKFCIKNKIFELKFDLI